MKLALHTTAQTAATRLAESMGLQLQPKPPFIAYPSATVNTAPVLAKDGFLAMEGGTNALLYCLTLLTVG